MFKAKAITPKKLNMRGMWGSLVAGVRATNDDVQVFFDATVATWDHKPEWVKELKGAAPLSKEIVGAYWTADQIYEWVTRGTEEHPIVARNAAALAFPGTFTAKTIPGVIGSGAGGSGGDTVIRKSVQHPGTQARDFDKAIKRKAEPIFLKRMTAATRIAAKVSGHYYA